MSQILKQQAAQSVLDNFLHTDKIVVGMGTGSTVEALINLLKDRWSWFSAVVSSSQRTTDLLIQKGVDVVGSNSVNNIDVYVDGADEVSALFYLNKGAGGALTREKILAYQAKKFVCMVDDSKMTQVLGKKPWPVEVLPFAKSEVARRLLKLTDGKATIQLRENFKTDNGGLILDVSNYLIEQPIALESEINQIPGVLASGIFAKQRPDHIVCASQSGLSIMDVK